MKLSMRNIHIYACVFLYVMCFFTAIWAWWCNGCRPGGDPVANGVIIIAMIIGGIATGLYEEGMKNSAL